jgi:hypothetical protein
VEANEVAVPLEGGSALVDGVTIRILHNDSTTQFRRDEQYLLVRSTCSNQILPRRLSSSTGRHAVEYGIGDRVTDVVPLLPIARRDFDRQEHVTAFISGYHVSDALPTPIEIVSRIVDERDRKRFEQKASLSPANFDASQRVSYTLDLPLATLEPGPYLFTMETKAGQANTTRNVRFNVK